MYDQPVNPFDASYPPFAGRKQAFSRLYQHLLNPNHIPQAAAFIGRKRTGKTVLLRNFNSVFDEHFIGVYLALEDAPLHDEDAWLRALYQAAVNAIIVTGLHAERLPDIPDACEDWREWLAKTALPETFRVIRPHRRLVYLLDNAGLLIDAIEAGKIKKDNPAFLQSILQNQLGMALTFNADDESRLNLLSPLVNAAEVYRLTNLPLAEVQELFEGMPDTVIQTIYRATGGHPELVRRFGRELWGRGAYAHLTEDDLKAVTPAVYAGADPLFRDIWKKSNRSERLVLTAVSSILYNDPMGVIDADKIETWLVETDYPTDLTTVHAAIRGLEYEEVLTNRGGGLGISAGLMQKWLLENARLEANTNVPVGSKRGQQHRILWAAAMAAVVLFMVLLLAILSTQAPTPEPDNITPTVTLAPDG